MRSPQAGPLLNEALRPLQSLIRAVPVAVISIHLNEGEHHQQCEKRDDELHCISPSCDEDDFILLAASLRLLSLRDHGAIQRLLQRGNQIILTLGGDIEPVIALSEALRFTNALLTCPRVIFNAIADDVDG
jgi:hypothetical protein